VKAYLVRIGVDQAFGEWNAPVDPATCEFVYVPIPESIDKFHPGVRRGFVEVMPSLYRFCEPRHLDPVVDLGFDRKLLERPMHLDPDFEHLTYGDDGAKRGAGIAALVEDDLIVFYAGLRPVRECDHRLLYGLVGLYVVEEVARVPTIPAERWCENAHTRKFKHWPHDIVVRAKPGVSGRLERCVPIGEWRDGAYRVRLDVLKAWGGLSVKNGFIQRSAVPPSFQSPQRFHEWFTKQRVRLIRRNN
jgi:hypothetical protein